MRTNLEGLQSVLDVTSLFFIYNSFSITCVHKKKTLGDVYEFS